MAKNKLLTEARKQKRIGSRTGALSWHAKLRAENPDLMRELDETIAAYTKGELRSNFGSVTDMWEWLREQNVLPESVSNQAFRRYITEKRHVSQG